MCKRSPPAEPYNKFDFIPVHLQSPGSTRMTVLRCFIQAPRGKIVRGDYSDSEQKTTSGCSESVTKSR